MDVYGILDRLPYEVDDWEGDPVIDVLASGWFVDLELMEKVNGLQFDNEVNQHIKHCKKKFKHPNIGHTARVKYFKRLYPDYINVEDYS